MKVDPTLCRSDRLVGQVLGSKGKLPPVYTELEINYFLLRRLPFAFVLVLKVRLLGVKATGDDKKQTKVSKLAKQEVLMVNIGSTSTGGKVLNVKAVLDSTPENLTEKQDLAKIALTQPACTEIGEKIALSRRIDKHWRLIGWGKITRAA